MDLLPYAVAYLGLGLFLVACVVRVAMWLRMPMHVRWELYPVAHEASRAHYGGSYLEETDWWTKPREKSLVGELKVMLPEILFLVALFEHNRKLWYRSFPFHFGLYLVIGCTGLMMLGGVLAAVAPALMTGAVGTLISYGTLACGVAGLVLGLLGALGLLERRLNDPNLRDFTAPADLFNLVFFVLAFGCALATFVLVDRDFSKVSAFVGALVTFRPEAMAGAGAEALLPTASVILLALLVGYIPMTHMSHFIGKYFAFHAIRWNDEPNLRGGRQEKTITDLLGQKVSWAAPHIQGGGHKTWVDVATEEQK